MFAGLSLAANGDFQQDAADGFQRILPPLKSIAAGPLIKQKRVGYLILYFHSSSTFSGDVGARIHYLL
jgi:hypothetical protein